MLAFVRALVYVHAPRVSTSVDVLLAPCPWYFPSNVVKVLSEGLKKSSSLISVPG